MDMPTDNFSNPNSNPNRNYRSPWSDSPRQQPQTKGQDGGGSRDNLTGWILAAAVIALLAGGVYYFFFRNPGGPNVGVEFSKPNQVLLGDPFVLSVSLSNYSDGVLKNAKLSLFLPDGVSFVGQSQGQRVSEQAVGDLGPGSINQQSFNLIVTSGPNALKHVQAKLVYAATQNQNSQFESSAEADVSVGQPAVSINFSAPQNVFSGQDFAVKVDYANNTGHDFKNLRLKIDYPPIFKFQRSTVAAEGDGNNSWNLGTLPAGSAGTISVTGGIVGPEKSFFSFNGSLTADFQGGTYAVNTQSVSVAISPAPLSLEIVLNNTSDYAAHSGETMNYAVNFKNNSDVIMQNAAIQAKLIGEMFDFTTLKSDGSFNSLSNTLTWIAANAPELSNLASGEKGTVTFTLKLKESYPIRLLSDKNFTLKVQAQIESPTVPPNTTAEKTISVAGLENKIEGKLDLAALAVWRDAASGILNSGPYPPKVNQSTQYTIHWQLTNFSTDASGITVSAYLQSGSRFTGKVKNNTDNSPVYNLNSGLVTWVVNSLPATKGVISEPAEAIFQIENTPAANQLNQNVPLLGETKLEWTDSFTGNHFQAAALPLDTALPYDETITVRNRTVQQ